MKKIFKILMFPVRIIEALLMVIAMIVMIPIITIYNMCCGVSPKDTIGTLWYAIQIGMDENEEEEP